MVFLAPPATIQTDKNISLIVRKDAPALHIWGNTSKSALIAEEQFLAGVLIVLSRCRHYLYASFQNAS
jgi:hypothetical protein